VKSFVKSYPDIIGYVDEEIASADSYGPEQRAREGLGDPCSVAFFAGHRVAMVQLKQEMPGTVDETKRAVAFMRQLAREVRGDEPAMSIEEHLAGYGAVEPCRRGRGRLAVEIRFGLGVSSDERQSPRQSRFSRDHLCWRRLDCRRYDLDGIRSLHRYRHGDYCCRVDQFHGRVSQQDALTGPHRYWKADSDQAGR